MTFLKPSKSFLAKQNLKTLIASLVYLPLISLAQTSYSTQSPTIVQNPNTIASSAFLDSMMTNMHNGFIVANSMLIHEGKQAKFTDQQIECFSTSENEFAVNQVQRLLQDNLTDKELAEANNFYASNAGKKHIAQTKLLMAMLLDDNKDLETVKISDAEQREINAFWSSKTGKKMARILKDKQILRPYFKPLVDKKTQACHMPPSVDSN